MNTQMCSVFEKRNYKNRNLLIDYDKKKKPNLSLLEKLSKLIDHANASECICMH